MKPPSVLSSPPATGGFSLIEVALALGIIGFALVAILGLFPVALDSATNSQRETHAALIARSIYTDLQSRPGPGRFLVTNKDFDASPTVENLQLNASEDHYLAYDSDGLFLQPVQASGYDSGVAGSGYVARVKVRELDQNSTTIVSLKGLSEINVTVEAPGSAPRAARAAYPFVSYLRQGKPTPTPTP